MNWNKALAIAAVVATAVGCGGGDPCARSSICPNDTPSTQAQRDQCRSTLAAQQSSLCYGEDLAFANCYLDNQVCGGDGKTDLTLWATKATNNCTNQKANYVSCCIKNPNATVCTGIK